MKSIVLVAFLILLVQIAIGSELKEEMRPQQIKHLPPLHGHGHHKHSCGGGWGWRTLPVEETEGIRDELYTMAEETEKLAGNDKLTRLMIRAADAIGVITEAKPEIENMDKVAADAMGRSINSRLTKLYQRLFNRF